MLLVLLLVLVLPFLIFSSYLLCPFHCYHPGHIIVIMLEAGDAAQEHMTETLKTFVGARMAVDRDRGQVPSADATAEDDALVSLLSGAGVSDPKGRAHFAQALRDHLLEMQVQDSVASNTDAAVGVQTGTDSMQSGNEQQQQSTAAHQSEHGHQHGIASHAHRAFLTDDVGSTADEPSKQDASSKQTA